MSTSEFYALLGVSWSETGWLVMLSVIYESKGGCVCMVIVECLFYESLLSSVNYDYSPAVGMGSGDY